MRILIATGIYPPEIGGPSEYAKNLKKVWTDLGNIVSVSVFSRWNYLPTGIRHLFYFLSILSKVSMSDFVLVLDTFSSALPAVLASKLFSKKIILRTGGDFLWEWYVERTDDLVPLREFYKSRIDKFTLKEKIVFFLTKFILNNVDAIIWSTDFQKEIFIDPYKLHNQKHFIVENYYGSSHSSENPKTKNFIASSRIAKLKNGKMLKDIFDNILIKNEDIILDRTQVSHDDLMVKLQNCYAVIVASITEISPNTVIESISFGKPFIVTKEVGIYSRIKEVAIFIDPYDPKDILDKVLWLSIPENYDNQVKKIKSFNFVHTWNNIAEEYLDVYKKIK